MRKPLAFFLRDWRIQSSYPIALALEFAGILFTTFFYFFLSRLLGNAPAPYLAAYGGDYFAFALIGLSLQFYNGTGLDSFVRSVREAQITGTLEAMLLTPTRLSTIILSSCLWDYSLTTVRAGVALAVGTLLVGLRLDRGNLGAALLILLLTIIAFSGIGIIASAFIVVFKRGDPVTWFFNAAATLVGGVFYPVEIMPQPLQWLSNFVPLTHAVRAMRRALLLGMPTRDLLPDIGILALFCLILVPLSLFVFRRAVNRARRDGSLTHY
ncbi:MAG: ABC transporter permease [Anaerolineae bacterium]|nr:ABC transporter permease [Anaerolineae bacterium]